jgi:hypothetical protein
LIASHELGHLAAAWVAGFHIQHFVVGPLAVIRRGDSFCIKHNRSKRIGGYVAALPDDPDNQLGWLIAYYAAGSAANLLVGALAFAGFWMTPQGILLLPFAVVSTGLALLSLIPYRIGPFSTDGRQMLNLLRHGPDRVQARASWRLLSFVCQKKRPRDWDQATLETVLGQADGSMFETGAAYMAYLHHLDAGRDDEAARFMECSIANLEHVPLLIASDYFIEATYFHVRRGSNPAIAREILTRIEAWNSDDISRLRAEAAVLFAEGQLFYAAQAARRAVELSERAPDLGINMFERDLALRLLTDVESSGPHSPAIPRSASACDEVVAGTPIA